MPPEGTLHSAQVHTQAQTQRNIRQTKIPSVSTHEHNAREDDGRLQKKMKWQNGSANWTNMISSELRTRTGYVRNLT